jgi:hypothetical protein
MFLIDGWNPKKHILIYRFNCFEMFLFLHFSLEKMGLISDLDPDPQLAKNRVPNSHKEVI